MVLDSLATALTLTPVFKLEATVFVLDAGNLAAKEE